MASKLKATLVKPLLTEVFYIHNRRQQSAIADQQPGGTSLRKYPYRLASAKPIDKDIGLRMFQTAERRLLFAAPD
jgi:hypothetical protein